jgi:hypothetical protein
MHRYGSTCHVDERRWNALRTCHVDEKMECIDMVLPAHLMERCAKVECIDVVFTSKMEDLRYGFHLARSKKSLFLHIGRLERPVVLHA